MSFITMQKICVHDVPKLYNKEVGEPSVKFNDRNIGEDIEGVPRLWKVWIWVVFVSTTQSLYPIFVDWLIWYV